MRGKEVRQLQQDLQDLGYPIKVDGIFGSETKSVVQQFQADEGLEADGIVGPKTFAALEAALERLAESEDGGEDAASDRPDRHGDTTSRSGSRDRDEVSKDKGEAEDVLDKLYQFAEEYLGVPYKYGGTSKKGIDCSALTQLAMQFLGYDIPRTSAEQVKIGQTVERSQLQAGDLVFFSTTGSGATHVAVYLEKNKLLNATSSKGVTYTSLNENYWDKRYYTAKRIIE
jgi:cell wall-associated NlpC family hydrolase